MGSPYVAELHARVLIAEREREVRRIAELAWQEVPLRRRIIPIRPMRAELRKARAVMSRIRNIRTRIASCDFRPCSVPEKG